MAYHLLTNGLNFTSNLSETIKTKTKMNKWFIKRDT